MKFVIITGMSGAGKSQAVKCMEDLGFYCVDNLPPALISKFVELCLQSHGDIQKVALVIDIRGGMFFDDLFASLDELKELQYHYEILFLDANDAILIKRFKETRRNHPLAFNESIVEGINKEREILKKLKMMATNIIDTTRMTPGQLKEELRNIYLEGNKTDNLIIYITSFGFKHGIPLDSDLVFDVRFLPNPYYVEELRDFTGKDLKVREYVMNSSVSVAFSNKLFELTDFLIPHYIKEGKNQLVISIGCTGGKHRSVTIAYVLYHKLKEKGYRAILTHRDDTLGERK
ncbi:RNase adapter RapZ [Clostridium formicaceticum]|uniref:GlmZ(SRNA)-inactivating NTPase n=1 Tax=Clostridium formicaceticum TaxID=1497 RepID=A0AAC9WHW2_9CLOT|nr:RNase adapter RapZ [Clostridium formicaceticum]AOY74783.1 RNase adaptor protein RapZ [Clostridium formicaceticum]ARE89174.1 glmZ(sRNA)-inactivating NTPase [Clostridium formicaceticum]